MGIYKRVLFILKGLLQILLTLLMSFTFYNAYAVDDIDGVGAQERTPAAADKAPEVPKSEDPDAKPKDEPRQVVNDEQVSAICRGFAQRARKKFEKCRKYQNTEAVANMSKSINGQDVSGMGIQEICSSQKDNLQPLIRLNNKQIKYCEEVAEACFKLCRTLTDAAYVKNQAGKSCGYPRARAKQVRESNKYLVSQMNDSAKCAKQSASSDKADDSSEPVLDEEQMVRQEELHEKYTEAVEKYGEHHPEAQKYAQQMDEIDAQARANMADIPPEGSALDSSQPPLTEFQEQAAQDTGFLDKAADQTIYDQYKAAELDATLRVGNNI